MLRGRNEGTSPLLKASASELEDQGSCTKAPEQENERGEREQKSKCKIFSSEIRSLVKRELMIEMKIMVATLLKLSASFILFVPAD